MANTWKKGNFGLESFDSIGSAMNELVQTFTDNLDANYSNVAITIDATFSDVSIPSDASYSDVSKPSMPTYINQGVST
jgi:hypothetical protein